MIEVEKSRVTAFQGQHLRVDVLDVELADGKRARREVVGHPGAVVALCRKPDGRWIFVRQFRAAIGVELFEAVAGTLDPDETPEACVRREIEEETGFKALKIISLGMAYPAPGVQRGKALLLPRRYRGPSRASKGPTPTSASRCASWIPGKCSVAWAAARSWTPRRWPSGCATS
jgi:ADP-ribose pyrophosphatase YjhB (NUDIX family)